MMLGDERAQCFGQTLFRGAIYSWLRRRASVPVAIAITP